MSDPTVAGWEARAKAGSADPIILTGSCRWPICSVIRPDREGQEGVNWVLTHQGADGWLGPRPEPRLVAEHGDAEGSHPVPGSDGRSARDSGHAALFPVSGRSSRRSSPLHDWGKFRWADEVVSVLWLYNRTGDTSLLDLARTLEAQGHDWKGEFAAFPFTSKTNKDQLGLKDGANPEIAMSAHGVNNAMALKTSGVWWLVSGSIRRS